MAFKVGDRIVYVLPTQKGRRPTPVRLPGVIVNTTVAGFRVKLDGHDWPRNVIAANLEHEAK
jgi:hypothetical protein